MIEKKKIIFYHCILSTQYYQTDKDVKPLKIDSLLLLKNTIISEKQRPLWQRVIAALFFTAAIALFFYMILSVPWTNKNAIGIGHYIKTIIYLIGFGAVFSFHQSVHINLKDSTFRSTIEIGPIKLGQWKKITNYEYVSIFHQPLSNGEKIFEVNLWYDRNQHWELFKKHDIKEAFSVGYELSELLNIEILDATKPNDYKWIDKALSIKKGELVYSD